MSKYVSIGKILNFHGIKGEVKVGCSKSQRDFVLSLKSVLINLDNSYSELQIETIRHQKDILIVKFKDYDSINDILSLKGQLLFVEQDIIRSSLAEDEFLIDELVGLEVLDILNNKSLGFVIGVSNNGASDLISIKTKSKKVCLVPFVKAIVPVVDIAKKTILINNIEGLLE